MTTTDTTVNHPIILFPLSEGPIFALLIKKKIKNKKWKQLKTKKKKRKEKEKRKTVP